MKNLTSFNTIDCRFSAFICFLLFAFQIALGMDTDKIVAIGDLEGRGHVLDSFIKNSEAFTVSESGEISLKPGYKFFFMGDASDRGDASLQILQTLLQLKEKYPDNVVLILGNRDLNKLRLPIELSAKALSEPPKSTLSRQPYDDWLKENGYGADLSSDGPTRLKWILAKTMAAPNAFEFRRQEIERTKKKKISDQAVFESFLSDFAENGIMTRYLKVAQLGYYSQEHALLAVHGGLTEKSLYHIPGRPPVETIKDWIPQLNEWAQNSIQLMLDKNTAGMDIVAYQQSKSNTTANNYSVIYGRNFNPQTADPELPTEKVQHELLSQGINTLMVGHTPIGDLPLVISNGKFRMLFLDNSTSAVQNASSTIIYNGTVKVKSSFRPVPEGPTVSYEHTLGTETDVGTKAKRGWVIAPYQGQMLTVDIDKAQKYKITYSLRPLSNKCLNFYKK